VSKARDSVTGADSVAADEAETRLEGDFLAMIKKMPRRCEHPDLTLCKAV
jgi:hypothetical protein